jgi:hypothetical protein
MGYQLFHFYGGPIYDTNDDSRVKNVEFLPLEQQSFLEIFHNLPPTIMYTNDTYFWKHEEDIFIDLFQPYRDDLSQLSHGNF